VERFVFWIIRSRLCFFSGSD